MKAPQLRKLSKPVQRRVWRERTLAWFFGVGGLFLISIIFGFLCAALLNFQSGHYLFGLASALFFGLLLWLFVKVNCCEQKIRIIPYYSDRVPEADTFLYGVAIASNSQILDEVAVAKNVKPLSAFGFKDDARWQKLVWHEPDEGIKTVESLLAEVHKNPVIFSDSAELQSDLNRILAALKAVQASKLKFCLLVWIGDSVSLMEMDRRKGFVHAEWKEWSPIPKKTGAT